MMMRFWFVFIFMFLPAICWGQIIVPKIRIHPPKSVFYVPNM